MAATNAAKNRAIRQEALRAQLAEQCRLQHVLDNIEKLEDLDVELEPNDYNRIRSANEQRLKLVNKYLPDLKSTELTGEGGGPVSLSDMSDTQLNAKLQELINATEQP